MKKIVTLCLLIAIARFTSAQKTGLFFDDPKFELQFVFADCFVKTAVTLKNDTKKAKFAHKYEITPDALSFTSILFSELRLLMLLTQTSGFIFH